MKMAQSFYRLRYEMYELHTEHDRPIFREVGDIEQSEHRSTKHDSQSIGTEGKNDFS